MQEPYIIGLENNKKLKLTGDKTLHYLVKSIFKFLFLSIKTLQSAVILSSLLVLIYFCLTLTNLNLPTDVVTLFDSLYKFQSNIIQIPPFFNMDFTFTLLAVELLLTAGALIYVLNFIIKIEGMYDNIKKYENKEYEKNFNINLEKKADKIDKNLNKFCLLLKINTELIDNSKSFIKQTNPIDINNLNKKIKNFLESKYIQNFQVSCKHVDNLLLFSFEHIEDCDRVFEIFFTFIKKNKEELKKFKIKFNMISSICLTNNNFQENIDLLQKLINISQNDRIIMTNEFKLRYDKINTKKFKYVERGEYSFNNEIFTIYTFEPHINLI